jgi:hypothetical protein
MPPVVEPIVWGKAKGFAGQELAIDVGVIVIGGDEGGAGFFFNPLFSNWPRC